MSHYVPFDFWFLNKILFFLMDTKQISKHKDAKIICITSLFTLFFKFICVLSTTKVSGNNLIISQSKCRFMNNFYHLAVLNLLFCLKHLIVFFLNTVVLVSKTLSALHIDWRVNASKIYRESKTVQVIDSVFFQQINIIGSTIARGSSCVHLDAPMGAKLKAAQRLHRKFTVEQMFLQNSVLTVLSNCYTILHSNELSVLLLLKKFFRNEFN